MKKSKIIPLIFLFFCFCPVKVFAGDLTFTPDIKKPLKDPDKCFSKIAGKKICAGIPTNSEINFIIDSSGKSIKAKARIYFQKSKHAEKVFFYFIPMVMKAWLNNRYIKPERRKAPGGEDWIIVLPALKNEKNNVLEMEYEVTNLTKWGLNWEPFWWRTDFSDSSDARFINAFSPATFEGARYPMTYSFVFKGQKISLYLFSSATEIQNPNKNTNKFKLKFSGWNNLSGPYFEFTSLKYLSFTFTFKGRYKPIPVTLYFDPALAGKKGNTVESIEKQAENMIRSTLENFEQTMGQYAFDKLLVKLYSLQAGDLPLQDEYSMEYSGAVVSRLELIPHEICHQWFGRGALPQDGQAGFVDELICDWYDYGNTVKAPATFRRPALLSPANKFTLRTPEESYQNGLFFAEIAYLYQKNNLDIITFLKNFYQRYRLADYSAIDFMNLLEHDYPGDFKPYFQRNIYGFNNLNKK